LVDVVAVEVHEAVALQVLEVDAITTLENVQARRRESLVQKVPGIFVEPGAGLGIELLFCPHRAVLREVQIAFRLQTR
jgi:hypothetical protein